MQKELLKALDFFKNANIAVIGDIMLDRYIKGRVKRISPEAPVPVIDVMNESSVAGGAANVAANIKALNAKAQLISVIGEDKRGEELRKIISQKNIDSSGLFTDKTVKTIEKIRIIAEHQQVARVDRDFGLNLDKKMREKLNENLETAIKKGINAVIFSDYGKGIFTPQTIKSLMMICHKNKIPVFVDPKVEHFPLYKKAACITPNTAEAFGGMRKSVKYSQTEAEKLGKEIMKKLSLEYLLITQSENGMTLFNKKDKNKTFHIPSIARDVFDVTGAGDTVISTLAVSYACLKDMRKAAIIANYAAGIAVGKLGTWAVSVKELKEEIELWAKP